jgi:hypothetical protein
MLAVARRKLIRQRSLEFPGALAGFDPSHIAAAGISNGRGFSGVASGANFLSLLSGVVGTLIGAPTASTYGITGPVCNFPGSSATPAATFAGQSTAIEQVATIAAIGFIPSLNAATSSLFNNTTASPGGTWLLYSSTGAIQLSGNGASGGGTSVLTLPAGAPFFVAASMPGAALTTNYLLKRLDTGVVKTDTQTSWTLSASAPNGIYEVGNGVSRSLGGGLAAVMFSPRYMSMQMLLKWSENPWKFWYPGSAD